ncbi:hypothetical protein CLG85_001730 [Yangia mangrovi]|uniref:XRE family transcriptional regulator n=1 Tax=Alloyangia mangrovi TaxID=1779329 RepID=A0ABT2KFI6_9RHOB|nr:hypothetical protein [Alloyangia mangrovi]MCT4369130.1 hypothetical protein [Alloyangia mangrovi]
MSDADKDKDVIILDVDKRFLVEPVGGTRPEAQVRSGGGQVFNDILKALPAHERKVLFDGIGKDVARVAGAHALASMLRESGLSGREIDARFGYDHGALSRTANGKSPSGPTLWRLYALAAALGFKLELKVSKRV